MKKLIRIFAIVFIIILNVNVLVAQMKLAKSFVEQSKTSNSAFGSAVADAGDVNGDGYSDIIVGSSNYYGGNNIGSAYLYFGGEPMDSVADLTFRGEQINNDFGYSVASAGDVNGDGYDDVIIGAMGAGSEGKAYIYFGGTNIDTVADVVIFGHDSYVDYEDGQFAISVSSAGDINGDGYDDVLIGSPKYENDDIYADNVGGVHLYYGGRNMDAISDLLFYGKIYNDKFGFSVASAGDINNDGYSDIIVGAYNLGKAYVYLGGATPDTTADLILADTENFGVSVSSAGDVNGDNYDDMIVGNDKTNSAKIYYGGSTLDAIADVDLIYVGVEFGAGGAFGGSVSTAGDVNNDGYDDVIVGDTFNHNNGTSGHAFIYLGSSTMDNIFDFVFTEGDTTYSSYGVSVACAGDINNDGYSDIIVGEDVPLNSVGSAYIYLGGQSMDNYTDVHLTGEGTYNEFGIEVTSGDFNGDGYPDIAANATISYSGGSWPVYIYFGGQNADSVVDVTILSSNNIIASAGDVNNDGFDDLLVGDPNADTSKGIVFLYYGGNPMNTTPDFVFKGDLYYGYFGTHLSSAGDVNGDGYDDMIIVGGGYANIFFGRKNQIENPDLRLKDASVQNFGHRVSCAGDVNNDGYSDVMVSGDHFGVYSNLGRVLIYFGGTSMDSIPDVGLSGQQGFDDFGGSISEAGDVNGDGFDDIIVGAFNNSLNGANGRAYIYYGGDPMNTSPDIIFNSPESNCFDFGYPVSNVGDINNDNYDDIIIGTPRFYIDRNHTSMGKGYVYYGGSSMSTTPVYSFMDYSHYYVNSADFRFCNVGDFNGDGHNNFIMSNFLHIPNGMAFLFYDSNSATTEVNIGEAPKAFALVQNYPNPFNPSTTINYQLSKNSKVSLKVYDILGREVANLVNEKQYAGDYKVKFDASKLSSGLYFYRISAGEFVDVKKMLLIK